MQKPIFNQKISRKYQENTKYYPIYSTHRAHALADLLRLKSRMRMYRWYKWTGLIVLSGCGGGGHRGSGGAPRALCTETLLLGSVRPAAVPPLVAQRGTTLVLRVVVLVLVMVWRRCIHTAFKPSSGAAIQWKKKTKSIREWDRRGRANKR